MLREMNTTKTLDGCKYSNRDKKSEHRQGADVPLETTLKSSCFLAQRQINHWPHSSFISIHPVHYERCDDNDGMCVVRDVVMGVSPGISPKSSYRKDMEHSLIFYQRLM